jgi:hypothetical protein
MTTKSKKDPFCQDNLYDSVLIDDAEYSRILWLISRSIENLEDKSIPSYELKHLHLLPETFKFFTASKIKRRGVNQSNLETESAAAVLQSITCLKELLMENGVINRKCAKVYFRTLELAINLFRSGSLVKKTLQSEAFSETQSDKGSKPRTVRDLSPEERKKRNSKIKSAFEKTKLTKNSFCKDQGKKNGLSPSAIREIIKS